MDIKIMSDHEELTVFPVDYEGARYRDRQAREERRRRRWSAWAVGLFFGGALLLLIAAITLEMVP